MRRATLLGLSCFLSVAVTISGGHGAALAEPSPSFLRSNWKKAGAVNGDFSSSNFFGSNFEGASILNTDMRKTQLGNVSWKGANVKGSNFKGAVGNKP